MVQLIELIGNAVGHTPELVSLPVELARPACNAYLAGPNTHVFILVKSKATIDLDYKDVVPMREAIPLYVQWLVETKRHGHPVELELLQDPFDYEAAWRKGDIAALKSGRWKRTPGFAVYQGLEVNPWDGSTQADKHEAAGEYDPLKGKRAIATTMGGSTRS